MLECLPACVSEGRIAAHTSAIAIRCHSGMVRAYEDGGGAAIMHTDHACIPLQSEPPFLCKKTVDTG